MQICHLSPEEAAAFEEYGIHPNCSHHRHLTLTKAATALQRQLLRPVGEEQGLCAVVDSLSNNRTWKKRISGGMAGMQLVRIVRG